MTNYVIPGIDWQALLRLAAGAQIMVSTPTATGYLLSHPDHDESTVWVRPTKDQHNTWLLSHVDATAILQRLCTLNYKYYPEGAPEFAAACGVITPQNLAQLEETARLARVRTLL